jgi:predicted nucleotidyltransferase
MGISEQEQSRVADALFTKVQQRVLGILFGQPDRSFLSKEVITLADSGTGAVHRELMRLTASGLVTVSSAGWERHYQANRQSPVFEELRSLVVKTFGLVEAMREALTAIADRIQVAFVYGSQASGTDKASSDVDVMIVSEDLAYAEVYAALGGAERILGRPINPTVVSLTEWRQKGQDRNHFLQNVSERPKLFVLGTEDDLA